MINERKPTDVLIEAMERSCTLFSQVVSENTRLRKLESHNPPTEPCIRRVSGKGQILTAEAAIAYDKAKSIEQSVVLHGVEHDFNTAIEDTKKAIKHPSLAGAIEPIVDKPAKWLAELFGEINSLKLAAVYPPNALTPEQRMAALFAVLQRLDRLVCSQEIGSHTTPDGTKRRTCGDKPILTIDVAALTVTFEAVVFRFDDSNREWKDLKKLTHREGFSVRLSAVRASRLKALLMPDLPILAKAIYSVEGVWYAIRTSDFSVKVIKPPQSDENDIR